MTHFLDNPPPFKEEMRYDFPLGIESVVIEAGSYQGLWADQMARRYRCRIYTFEPIPDFHRIAEERLRIHSKVVLSNVGLASTSREETWHIKGEMTGAFNGEGPEQKVMLINFLAWMDILDFPRVIDLLAINCEGGEFELLEAVIVSGAAHRFRFIMVQFHGVGPTPDERKRGIRESLSKTHKLRFFDETHWECWELNT